MRSDAARALVALGIAAVMSACDNRPPATGPSPVPDPGPRRIVGLEIMGPDRIPPGATVQYTAAVRSSDGSAEPVTNLEWASQNSLVTVTPSGLVTAGGRNGSDILRARLRTTADNLLASREILVLPENTYRVTGTVTENVADRVPLPGARVRTTDAAQVEALTDSNGRYELYGVPPNAEIAVTRDGYQPVFRRLELSGHATENFELALAAARLELTGDYTLAIDAGCSPDFDLPLRDDLRHRQYAATLSQTGPVVDIVLTDPDRFKINSAKRGDRFAAWADAAGATLDLGDNFFQYSGGPYDPLTYPAIVERLPDSSLLVVDGKGVVMGSSLRLAGTFEGFILHYSSTFPSFPTQAFGFCYSKTHRISLTRR